MIIHYDGYWYCDYHDEDFTSEGICPGCYTDMQFGDARADYNGNYSNRIDGVSLVKRSGRGE